MTGRDLIIYILANRLEDEPIFKDGKFIGTLDTGEAASQLDIGSAALFALIDRKNVHCYYPKYCLIPANEIDKIKRKE